jgi:hypothetical protein
MLNAPSALPYALCLGVVLRYVRSTEYGMAHYLLGYELRDPEFLQHWDSNRCFH